MSEERTLSELLNVILDAADAGDEDAMAWLLGEGYIHAYPARVEFVRFDGRDSRTGPRAKAWSRAVRRRDGWTCKRCGSDDDLQTHHVKEWARHPEARFDLDNGETVCVECHAAEHPRQAHLIRKSKAQKRREPSRERE